jgi:predicted Zn-dependent peptidase
VRDTAPSGADAASEARRRVLQVVDPLALTARVGRPLTVSIVSSQDESRIVAAAAAALIDLPRRIVTPNIFHPLRPDASEERIPFPGAVQVEIVAGLPGAPVGSPDRRALELLNYIVGVPSYGARLGWALTKAGLTYDEQASTEFGPASGHVLFSTTSNTHNTNAVIQALREVIAQVGEHGVQDWELREAKAFTLGRMLLYGAREGSGAAAIAYALSQSEVSDVELLDLPAFSRAYLDVTLDDVNRVAREYYRPERLKVVAAGAIPDSSEKSVYPPGTFMSIFAP